jgi:flagellar basal-body rod modification protein FlgD
MPIDQVNSVQAQSSQQEPRSIGNSTGELGKHDFLKLMITQLQNQNPLEPTDTDKFVEQLNAMTTVEELQNIRTVADKSLPAMQFGYAAGFIGQQAQFLNAQGVEEEGVVKQVDRNEKGEVFLDINNQRVPYDRLRSVKEPQVQDNQ